MNKIEEKVIRGIRELVALQLWQIGAVKVNLQEPYKLVSGNYSPIYINCRQLISIPAFLDLFTAAARMIFSSTNLQYNVIAGGETAGIPFASFLARSFDRPLIYVRKASKSYGISSRIEGTLADGDQVLLVEDLITDAGSKLSFIHAIRDTGAAIKDVLVVFDRLQGGRQALQAEGLQLHAIADMDIAMQVAQDIGLLTSEQFESVNLYLQSPPDWHEKHGLDFRK